jgi:hypothetical protein
MSTIPCGHRRPEPGCPLCDLARRDARYARLWGVTWNKPRLSLADLARRREH